MNIRAYTILRWGALLLLLGWYIKLSFFGEYFLTTIVRYPIHHHLFPRFFQEQAVAQIAYGLPLGLAFLLFIKNKKALVAYCLILMLSSLTLMWHNDTYNDATFVTSFWVSLWLLWLAVNVDSQEKSLYVHAGVLAQLVVGMIFWGGFIGKLTPAYFNGEVFYHIFIEERTYWPFSWIAQFPIDQQYGLAKVFSLLILLGEGFLALGPIIPIKLYTLVVLILVLVMVIINTWMILSVLICLAGILLVCCYWKTKEEKSYA